MTEVNYQHGTLKFFDPETFAYDGRALDFSSRYTQMVSCRFPLKYSEQTLKFRWIQDPEKPLVLFPRFIKAHDLHANLGQ